MGDGPIDHSFTGWLPEEEEAQRRRIAAGGIPMPMSAMRTPSPVQNPVQNHVQQYEQEGTPLRDSIASSRDSVASSRYQPSNGARNGRGSGNESPSNTGRSRESSRRQVSPTVRQQARRFEGGGPNSGSSSGGGEGGSRYRSRPSEVGYRETRRGRAEREPVRQPGSPTVRQQARQFESHRSPERIRSKPSDVGYVDTRMGRRPMAVYGAEDISREPGSPSVRQQVQQFGNIGIEPPRQRSPLGRRQPSSYQRVDARAVDDDRKYTDYASPTSVTEKVQFFQASPSGSPGRASRTPSPRRFRAREDVDDEDDQFLSKLQANMGGKLKLEDDGDDWPQVSGSDNRPGYWFDDDGDGSRSRRDNRFQGRPNDTPSSPRPSQMRQPSPGRSMRRRDSRSPGGDALSRRNSQHAFADLVAQQAMRDENSRDPNYRSRAGSQHSSSQQSSSEHERRSGWPEPKSSSRAGSQQSSSQPSSSEHESKRSGSDRSTRNNPTSYRTPPSGDSMSSSGEAKSPRSRRQSGTAPSMDPQPGRDPTGPSLGRHRSETVDTERTDKADNSLSRGRTMDDPNRHVPQDGGLNERGSAAGSDWRGHHVRNPSQFDNLDPPGDRHAHRPSSGRPNLADRAAGGSGGHSRRQSMEGELRRGDQGGKYSRAPSMENVDWRAPAGGGGGWDGRDSPRFENTATPRDFQGRHSRQNSTEKGGESSRADGGPALRHFPGHYPSVSRQNSIDMKAGVGGRSFDSNESPRSDGVSSPRHFPGFYPNVSRKGDAGGPTEEKPELQRADSIPRPGPAHNPGFYPTPARHGTQTRPSTTPASPSFSSLRTPAAPSRSNSRVETESVPPSATSTMTPVQQRLAEASSSAFDPVQPLSRANSQRKTKINEPPMDEDFLPPPPTPPPNYYELSPSPSLRVPPSPRRRTRRSEEPTYLKISLATSLPGIAKILAEAIREDPTLQHLFPDIELRKEWLLPFCVGLLERVHSKKGFVAVSGTEPAMIQSAPGVIAAYPPGAYPLGKIAGGKVKFNLVLSARNKTKARLITEGGDVYSILEDNHPKERHWFIAAVGVVESMRKQGVATDLVEAVMGFAEVDQVPVYTKTSCAQSVQFFTTLGFQSQAILVFDNAPDIFILVWKPQPR